MNIDFRKNLLSSYMVISDHSFSSQGSYPLRLLARECPEGLLSLSLEQYNGCISFLYDITSKHSFEKLFETKKFNADTLKNFLRSLKSIILKLEEFLLDPDDLILAPHTIYTDLNASEFYFCYCPGYGRDCGEQLKTLSNRMLNLTDYDDAEAVKLCFEFNRMLHNGSFSLKDLDELISNEPFCKPQTSSPADLSFDETAGNIPVSKDRGSIAAVRSAGNSSRLRSAGSTSAEKSSGSRPAGDFSENLSGSRPAEKSSGRALPFSKKAGIYFRNNSFSQIFEDFNSWKLLKKIRAVEEPVRVPDIPPLSSAEKPLRFEPYVQPVQGSAPHREDASSGEGETILLDDRKGSEAFPETAGAEGDVFLRYSLEKISGTEHETVKMTVFPFTIGKSADACDMRIDVPTVSRLHARIYKNSEDSGSLEFEDLNSRNGSFINGAPAAAYTRFPVSDGDILRLANVEILVHIE